jgi:hypothetical protein
MKHTSKNLRLISGIAFALNYPTEFELIRYDPHGKYAVYHVRYLEGIGWHHLALDEAFVRSCMTYLGPKAWTAPTNYEEIFNDNN